MTVNNENKAIHNAFINEDIDLEEIKDKYENTKKKIQETKEKRRLKRENKGNEKEAKVSHNVFINEDLENLEKQHEQSRLKMEEMKEKRRLKHENKLRNKEKEAKDSMKNITINIPNIYDEKIQWLIDNKFIVSRSEAVRTAIREFLQKEYNHNLELLGYFKFIQK